MFKKYCLILALTIIGTQINAAEESQVELDLNDNSVYSKKGVDIKFENNKIKAFNLRQDTENNKLIIKDKIIMDSYNLSGDMRVEGTSGEVSLDGKTARFDENFTWMEVGKVTGAEKPNDKIYFGSESANYSDKKLQLNQAWLTTDPKVNIDKNNNDIGYYLNAESIFIEPNKQVTLKNVDLFVKNKDIIPFSIPWYRFNIRNGSKVPLFPQWGTDDDYGWTITQGIIYGSKDGKYQGGFAPKFADEMGLLIGRMENWYTFDTIGQSKLNVDNALIWKKDHDDTDESYDDRWNVNYTHDYSGDNGYFNFGFQSITYNENSSLEDIIDDLEDDGIISDTNMGSVSNYYTLSSELNKLGANQDISISAKVKLTDDVEAYHYTVYDAVDDMSYGTQTDHDLYSDIKVTKDNEKYTMSSYYKYLDDVDPGSNKEDLQSEAEDYGFLFKDKENNIKIQYDYANGDKYRLLKSWERNPNLSTLSTTDEYGLTFDYTPWTVSKYSKDDSKKFIAEFGEYDLTENTQIKTGYTYNYINQELDQTNDALRTNAFSSSSRLSEYNKSENILKNKQIENRGYATFYTDLVNMTVAGGTSKETVETREGMYDGSTKTYTNKSNFYEFGLDKNKVSLGSLGEIDIYGNIRQDQYDNSSDYNGSDDKVNRYKTGLTHRINLDNNLNNEFKISMVDYSYSGDDSDKTGRLISKTNEIKYEDNLKLNFGNDKIIDYKVSYTDKDKARDSNKDGRIFNNELTFLNNGEKLVSGYYNLNKRYSNENITGDNYNDLNLENYGVNLFAGKNEWYYKNENEESYAQDVEIEDSTSASYTGEYSEDASANIYGYTRKYENSKLNFEYVDSKDSADFEGKNLLDINNRIYSTTYTRGNEIEHSYKISYEDYDEDYRYYDETDYNNDYTTDVISFKYTFKDKRVSDSDLRRYATKEFNKNEGDITSEDLTRVKEIIDGRSNTSFDLSSSMDSKINYNGDVRESFSFALSVERKQSRYDETHNYFDSLQDVGVGIYYSKNGTGFGYSYSEEADYDSSSWESTEKEHKLSYYTKIGKPSEGWNLKTYIEFDDVDSSNESYIDEAGIRIGKEMGYYEWAVAYNREYSTSTNDYEWKVALQFTLLTFPNNTIFGFGANKDSDSSSVSPKTYLFNGINIDD